MIVAALFIGALTAYYFGVRAGGGAALGAAGLFVLSVVVPSQQLLSYGLVAAFVLGVLVIGPRMPDRKGKKADFLRLTKRAAALVLRKMR